jgi:hypothetical protein
VASSHDENLKGVIDWEEEGREKGRTFYNSRQNYIETVSARNTVNNKRRHRMCMDLSYNKHTFNS